jgi:hypothetical protein
LLFGRLFELVGAIVEAVITLQTTFMCRQALNSAFEYRCEHRRTTKWGIVFGDQTPTTTIQTTSNLVNPLSFKKIPFKKSPLEIFNQLYKHYPHAYLLESIEGPKNSHNSHSLGFDPQLTIQIKNGTATTRNPQTGHETKQKTNDPLQVIKQALAGRTTANKDIRFAGAPWAYISYDAIRYWEKLHHLHR